METFPVPIMIKTPNASAAHRRGTVTHRRGAVALSVLSVLDSDGDNYVVYLRDAHVTIDVQTMTVNEELTDSGILNLMDHVTESVQDGLGGRVVDRSMIFSNIYLNDRVRQLMESKPVLIRRTSESILIDSIDIKNREERVYEIVIRARLFDEDRPDYDVLVSDTL